MKNQSNASIIEETIKELGYHSLDNLRLISIKSPSTLHLVIEKIITNKVESILLLDSQTNAEAQSKRLDELKQKEFHRPSFINGWNECLNYLKQNYIK